MDRFAHEQAYRGDDLLEKLAKVSITVCGAGALGSNLVDNLCRQGMTNIKVIDMDRVEAHNINTQAYGHDDVGRLKVAALAGKMFRFHRVKIEEVKHELTEKNAKRLLSGSDLIIDAFDNHASRVVVRDFCRDNDGIPIPCLHMGLSEGYAEVVWDDVYRVPGDVEVDVDVCEYPLARNIVMLAMIVGSEEILDFCLNDEPKFRSMTITLGDLAIRPYI